MDHQLPEKDIDKSGDCWIWTGYTDRAGYGRTHGGRLAHRTMWGMIHGHVPDGKCVLHRCDVRNCVNPAHLFLGTQAENVADMDAKGRRFRGPVNQGAKNHFATLNETDVRLIFLLREKGLTQKEIAKRFGISQSTVSTIINRKTWKHI